MEKLERSREIEICHLGARSRAKCVLREEGACGITLRCHAFHPVLESVCLYMLFAHSIFSNRRRYAPI